MAFRADDAASAGYEKAEQYFLGRALTKDEEVRKQSRDVFQRAIGLLGNAVESYPSWHPLVRHHNSRNPVTIPDNRCGYEGLDHTRYFTNGFITCPYSDGTEVIKSVNAMRPHPAATITAEILDAKLYSTEATAVMVRCHWHKPLEADGTIPLKVALPLLLEMELPCCWFAEVAETWETMRPYFLGSPHGSRSSLFLNQEAGQGIKKIWNALIYTGMYGPIDV